MLLAVTGAGPRQAETRSGAGRLRRDAAFATRLRRRAPQLTTQARQKAGRHLGKRELLTLAARLHGFAPPTETRAVCGLPRVAELGGMLSSEIQLSAVIET
jgi:hypothetical protein